MHAAHAGGRSHIAVSKNAALSRSQGCSGVSVKIMFVIPNLQYIKGHLPISVTRRNGGNAAGSSSWQAGWKYVLAQVGLSQPARRHLTPSQGQHGRRQHLKPRPGLLSCSLRPAVAPRACWQQLLRRMRLCQRFWWQHAASRWGVRGPWQQSCAEDHGRSRAGCDFAAGADTENTMGLACSGTADIGLTAAVAVLGQAQA